MELNWIVVFFYNISFTFISLAKFIWNFRTFIFITHKFTFKILSNVVSSNSLFVNQTNRNCFARNWSLFINYIFSFSLFQLHPSLMALAEKQITIEITRELLKYSLLYQILGNPLFPSLWTNILHQVEFFSTLKPLYFNSKKHLAKNFSFVHPNTWI